MVGLFHPGLSIIGRVAGDWQNGSGAVHQQGDSHDNVPQHTCGPGAAETDSREGEGEGTDHHGGGTN